MFDLKISRSLAAKTALAIRYDALGEDTNAEMGLENRAKLEARVRQLEERGVSSAAKFHEGFCFKLLFSLWFCKKPILINGH